MVQPGDVLVNAWGGFPLYALESGRNNVNGPRWWCHHSDGRIGSWAEDRLEIVLEAPPIPEPLQCRAPILE